MTSIRATILVLTLVAAACAAVPGDALPPDSDAVPALRYRRLAYDSMAWHDGDGRMIEEIWFPARGIICNVTEEWSIWEKEDGTMDTGSRPELHAFFSPILNRYPETFLSGTQIEAPTEAVRVPRALAERIFRMAELDRELKEGREAVGREAMEGGVLRFVKGEEGR